jgi:hypothetical protein
VNVALPVCHSRREFADTTEEFFCAHPYVHAHEQIVKASVCLACDYWKQPPPAEFRPFDPAGARVRRTGPCFFLGKHTSWQECKTCQGKVRLKVFECLHPLHDETTYEACRQCRDYEHPLERGAIRQWAAGVTTAPRPVATLERTLRSLADAGWSAVRLFAEPGSLIPAAFGMLPVTWRESRVGAFGNWHLALSELFMRDPKADAYLLCQDDVLLSRRAREYLETELWPASSLGAFSLYAGGPQFSQLPTGFHVDASGWEARGALAYVFPNAAVRLLLGHPYVLNHRRRGPNAGMADIDGVVGAWCLASGLPAYIHAPSLARHIGDISTIHTGAQNEGFRREATFVEDAGALVNQRDDGNLMAASSPGLPQEERKLGS